MGKSIEEILEELKKENFKSEFTDEIIDKLKPYIDSKFEEQKEYIDAKFESHKQNNVNVNLKLEKENQISKTKKTGFVFGYTTSIASAVITGLSAVYNMVENFPERPAEMYALYLASAMLFSTWYVLFHKAHYSGFYRFRNI